MELKKIIQDGYDLGMSQHLYEITSAVSLLKEQNIKDFIEIGTDRGGTFLVWSKISDPNGLKISIDWSHGRWGNNNYDVEKRNQTLKSLGKNVHILDGNSHSEILLQNLKSILGDRKVDFLFIDGDHSYIGVKLDYYMYKEFVKPGGWIGFHDIKDTEFHRNNQCFVADFWNELNGEKVYFFGDNSDWGGIGLIHL